ncbi:hypothetical protein RND71_035522 [Anisodus tanguticus]|uniref:Prolyl 4-hydroxylase alpha subunit domain-containing protein n=1 Tax=Anisodus tanguticus TaxID=243964 RepID=A0AAE1R508_9SOLA|nr:hypothetical protein RND71_035522 [Anisodus tanguticus]
MTFSETKFRLLDDKKIRRSNGITTEKLRSSPVAKSLEILKLPSFKMDVVGELYDFKWAPIRDVHACLLSYNAADLGRFSYQQFCAKRIHTPETLTNWPSFAVLGSASGLQQLRQVGRWMSKVAAELKEKDESKTPAKTGIYFPEGHERLIDDIPNGAASLTQTYWLRTEDAMCQFMNESGPTTCYCFSIILKKCIKHDFDESDSRKCTFISASDDSTGVLASVETKIAKGTMIPRNHGEAFNILRYELGQRYMSHYDAFNPAEYGPQKSQREYIYTSYKTFFYHNSNYTIMASLHGSCPVIKGEKRVSTKWIRTEEQQD